MKIVLIGASILYLVLLTGVIILIVRTQTMWLEMMELRELLDQLRSNNEVLDGRIASLQSLVEEFRASEELLSDTACNAQFANGLFLLSTNTGYGPPSLSTYQIYHVSVPVSEWTVNAGMRLSSFGLPTDFYVDYDGDGRIDTALAARVAREIPIVGNTISDRLLADSSVHQRLYSVFRCEWRNAEYTSADDINESMSGAALTLWRLVEAHSEEIASWIQSR